MSPWEGIQEFMMVVEAGSFTAAAKRLGVSSAHVSRQVARLEDRVNVKLLARSTRVVRLTDAGNDYYRKVEDLTAGMEEANQAAAGADALFAGRIRVSAAGAFAKSKVARILARFAAEHPRVTIEMDFNTRFVDLIDQGFDFAVRYGVLTHSGLIARRLSSRKMVCVASPAYLAQHGTPSEPSQLKGHACLIMNSDRWAFMQPDTSDPIEIRVSGPWRANSGHATRMAAIEGLGISYAPLENLQDAIENGELHTILEGYEDCSRSSWLVYPERRHMPVRVRRAMDYLIKNFKA